MFGLTILDILILIVYFAVIIVIGVISSYFVKNQEDFVMGGRRFGKAMMVMFAFGAGTHADNALGVAAQSYKVGFAGIWYQWMNLFTLPIYWLLVPIFRRARVLTTADFFERRFGTGFMLLYAIFAMYVAISFTGVMLYGSARLVESLIGQAVSWQWIILLISSISFFYGIAGGLIAAVWNDFFQGILTIVMSILIIPFFWVKIGGLDGFQSHLPEPQEIFRLVLSKDMTLFWIIMMSISSLVGMVTQPHIMSNAAAGKSEMDSRVGFVGGILLKRLMTIPWALTGIMAVALYGAGKIQPDHVFGTISKDLLPNGFVGLMLACVMASVMDNCAVMMLSSSGIYTNSIHKKFINHNHSEKNLITVNRYVSIGFAVVSIALSYCFKDITEAMRFLIQTVPLMGIAFFFAVCWPRANRYGAFASFFAAVCAVAAGRYWLGLSGDAGLPWLVSLYLGCGIAAGVLVSILTPSEPKYLLDRFYLLLKTPIGQEEILHKAGLKEIPGTGTFELTAVTSSTEMPDIKTISEGIDYQRSRKQSIYGFVIISLIVIVLLVAVKILAWWLANG